MMENRRERLSIFIEGSFDYAHFLPTHEKCFPLHGHTSAVKLEVTGKTGKTGMLIDFADLKGAMNRGLASIDHKLVVSESYCRREGKQLVVEYGDFLFRLPQEHTFVLKGEGTAENIASELAKKILEETPSNVDGISLTITEGLRKGTTVVLERVPTQ